jgi:Sel1 repeat
MKYLHRIISSFLLVCLSMALPASVFASEVIDHSSGLFNFQQKLANKGNARAQYKLATMYEAGIGVDPDIAQARQWYTKASNAGIKAASDRNIFLEVKQQGYKKTRHSSWLEGIKADAGKRKTEAMLLLGQLYGEGIGVKKDLNKSLELLIQVSSSGDANVDDEIISIQNKIDAQKIITRPKQVRQSQKKQESKNVASKQVKAKPAEAELVEARSVKTVQTKKKSLGLQQAKAKKEQLIKAEKRRKYEAVMAQLRLEQQKIDEQQKQVSGGEMAAIDDEI